jgi:hypothetical protein
MILSLTDERFDLFDVRMVPSGTAAFVRTSARLMRHTKLDTTLAVYTQVIDGALQTAVDRVGSELFTIVHNPEGGELRRRKGWLLR